MSLPLSYHPSQLDNGILCTASDNYERIMYPHSHPDFELTVILNGVHGVDLRNRKLRLTAGELLLLRPNEVHSRYLIEPGRYNMIAFPANLFMQTIAYLNDGSSDLLKCQEPPMTVLSRANQELITEQIQRVNFYCSTDSQRAISELKAMLVMLCTTYLKAHDDLTDEKSMWLTRLMFEMRKVDNMRRGVPAMLELVPYTHEYLCREFRRMIHCTPTEYLNTVRLDHARKMLKDTNESIIDICFGAGYDSVSYFYHLFRRRFNCTPNQYRKKMLRNDPAVPPEQAT